MTKTLFCTLLACAAWAQADAQWERIHPTSDLFRSFHKAVIPPGSTGYFALGHELAVSANEGQHWEKPNFQLPVAPPFEGYDIAFVNADTAFLSCRNQVFKTTDRGQNWTLLLNLDPSNGNYQSSAWFRALHFLNPLEGYAVGDFEKIFKTTDGGATWDTLSWTAATAPYVRYTDVVFLDKMVGYVAGHEVDNILMNFDFTEFVLKTTDGGQTWSKTVVPVIGDYRTLLLQFTNADTCFVHFKDTQGHDQMWNSADGGDSWLPRTPPLDKIYATCWVDGLTGLAYGRDFSYEYHLFRTEDGGAYWAPVEMPVFDNQMRDVIREFAFSGNRGFAVGDGGNLMTSADKGKTWESRNKAFPNFFSLDFPSENIAYASGSKGFFKSDDGGENWSFRENSDSLTVADMEFKDNANGYFYGFRNLYYRISEGGDSARLLHLPRFFVSFSKMIVRGDSLHAAGPTVAPTGNVWLRSADGGANWDVLEIDETAPIVDIDIAGNTYLLATTAVLKKSEDVGNTWTTLLTPQNDYIQLMEFITPSRGLVFLSSGKVLFTEDQGISWAETGPFSSETILKDFLVADDTLVFAYGTRQWNGYTLGTIWRSTDGGKTWAEENLPVTVDIGITDMDVAGQYLYATGGYGLVFRQKRLPQSTGAEEPDFSAVLKLYPVPADDYLMFELPEEYPVLSVRVIGADGRVFSQPDATSERRIPIQHLPQGVYFLAVQTDAGVFLKQFYKAGE